MIFVTIKKEKVAKIRNRYGWVFADEVKEVFSDQSMGIANVFSEEKEYLGRGLFLKSSSKIVRMLTLKEEEIDEKFFFHRIHRALQIRQKLFSENVYRLVNAESDFLPGLIIDRYGSYLVLQIRHPVLEEMKSMIVEVLVKLFAAEIQGIQERSDFESTPDLFLNRYSGVLWGEVPDEIVLVVNGLQLLLHLKVGQKTGLFLDLRDTRQKARELVEKYHLEGREALDVFCYTGEFSLVLAKAGMRCTAVDKSESDLEIAKRICSLNHLDEKIRYVCADAFQWLKTSKELFHLIILDPPSLIKSQKEKSFGIKLLTDLMKDSIPRLAEDGIIGLCTCSYHLGWEEMIEAARKAALKCEKALFCIDQTTQSKDHPWLLQMPETLYLKCLWLQVRD